MKDARKIYEEILSRESKIIAEIDLLKTNEKVKRYLKLKEEISDLDNKRLEAYKDVKYQEYDSCNHRFIYFKIEHDRYEGRSYRSCGCIKCGLNTEAAYLRRDWLPYTQQIMHDYLNKKREEKIYIGASGKADIDVVCDLDLAHAIYSRIKEVHPNIDDETAIKYFEIALDNIRNIKVSDERKENRAKRLSLYNGFRKWNKQDVISD